MGVVGAASWVAVATFAILLFASKNLPGGPFQGYLNGYSEFIGFSWAFAASGAVSGSAVVGAFGTRRGMIAMGVALALAIVLASCLAAWGFPPVVIRRYGVSPVSASYSQGKLIAYLRTGTALGLVSGSILVAVAVAARFALRREAIRRLGLALVPVLVAATVWALPPASFRLAGLADRLGWGYAGGDSEAVVGAASGSATGALAGAAVALLVARCVRDGRRSPGDPPASPRPGPPS